jgi:pimeloyl-ACP methyl ester carboxylesterase
MTPEIRYARSGDLRIAYQVVGSGPLDLVYVSGFVSNLELIWEDPAPAHFFSRLAGFSRLILFDKRGTGLSDRGAGIANLEERMDDVRAIMDAAGSDRAALFGMSEGGPMSLMFAATYPDRVHALALYGSYARHPTLSAENIEKHAEVIHQLWGTGEYWARSFVPSMVSNEGALRSFARRERLSASPSAAVAVLRMNSEIDVRHILRTIRVPALILHRVADARITADAGRYLAANIPNAKYVELPGSNHLPLQERDIARPYRS